MTGSFVHNRYNGKLNGMTVNMPMCMHMCMCMCDIYTYAVHRTRAVIPT